MFLINSDNVIVVIGKRNFKTAKAHCSSKNLLDFVPYELPSVYSVLFILQ